MRHPALTLGLVSLLTTGCGGDAAEEATRNAAEALRDAADAIQQQADGMRAAGEEGESREPALDAQALQDRLPDRLAGMTRTSSERQSVGAAGLNLASATAVYEDGDRRLELQLSSGPGILMGPAMAFNVVEFDRTTDTGFERTVRLHGFKGMQSYEERGDRRSAELTLLVDDRVLIQMEAEGLTMDELEDALDDLDPASMD